MDIDGNAKVCAHCHEIKPLSAFNKCSKSPTGTQSWCRECQKREYDRTYPTKVHPSLRRKRRKAVEPLYDESLTEVGSVTLLKTKVIVRLNIRGVSLAIEVRR